MNRFRNLMMIPFVRTMVGRLRLWYYFSVRKYWKELSSEHAFDVTLMHNKKSLRNFSISRMDLLIRPLSAIEVLNGSSGILVIGPRNESDLLKLWAHGFNRSRIRGLDLMSYSPWIDVGDMHNTSYPDNQWDAIVCGWTLSYSRTPALFAKELLRIAKSGCAIAIAVEYASMTYEEAVKLDGYSIEDKGFERVNSVDQILHLFEGYVDHVYFSHDAPLKRHHTGAGLIPHPSGVAVIFTVKK